MQKARFHGQHFGIFEKSLRTDDSTKNTTTEQRTPRINETEDMEEHLGKKTQQQNMANTVEGKRRQSVFYTHEIKKIMDEILKEKLSTQSYDANTCRVLCISLSEDIKSRVKNLGMERFRLICSVSIGSNCGQGILMASRFLWNDFRDNFSTSSFQNASLFAVAIVFGVLKE